MKKWSMVLLVVVAAVMIAGPARAQVSGGTSATCNTTFVQRFTPGFTLTPSSGPQFSAGPAPINCTGTIHGHQISGPGIVENEGNYHNSTCLLDKADGTVEFSLPTSAGPVVVDATFRVTRVGAVLSVEFDEATTQGSGQALVVPTKGDCVLNPITEALVLMSITLRDKPAATLERSCGLDLTIVQLGCRTRSAG